MIKTIAGRAFHTMAVGRLVRDQRGNVAVIFALVALPLLSVLSLAIDYGRASHVQTTLQNATDAAAQAAIRLAGADSNTIRNSFVSNFRANLPADLKETPFELVVDKDKGTVEAKVETRVATSLIGIVGIDSLNVSAQATQRFASIGGGSRRGSSGAGGDTPSAGRAPGMPAGLGVEKPGAALSGETVQRLREMGYDLDNPELQRRAAEAEAKMRELMAQHPGLFRGR